MSDIVTYRLIMDFTHPMKAQIINLAKDDVNSVKVRCILNNSGEAFSMQDITSVFIYAVNANNNVIYQQAEIITETIDGVTSKTNVIEYTFPANITGYPGKVTCYFNLCKDGYQLSTPKFYLDIGAQLFDPNEYVSEDKVIDIQNLITREQNLMNQIESSVQSGIKNPYSLAIDVEDGDQISYDGSEPKVLTLSKAAQMEVVNSLQETEPGKILDAYQGAILKEAFDRQAEKINQFGNSIQGISDAITALEKLTNYSTSEIKTGEKWIDGKDIYKKTFIATAKSFAHGITGITKVIDISATYHTSGSYAPYGFISCSHEVAVQGTNIYLYGTAGDRVSSSITINITIKYVK